VIDWSNRFGRMMPHVLDVPQFTGIRIHAGSRPEDTEGCPRTGRTRGNDWVGESRLAYDALFSKLQAAQDRGEEIWLEVT
jgi:hypothetical protein